MASSLNGQGNEAASLPIRRGSERRFIAPPPAPTGEPPPVVYTPPPATPAVPVPPVPPAPDPHALLDLVMKSLQTAGSVAVPPAGAALSVYDATLAEPGQATPEISTNELRRFLDAGSALVCDCRTQLEYAVGHIPGAVTVGPKPETPMSAYTSDAAEIAGLVPNLGMAVVLYCNGPFCGKSRRVGEDLVKAGFTNVCRYQLGTPMWRALCGPMVIEPEGARYVLRNDRTAVLIDARDPREFAAGSAPRARNVPITSIVEAKDDGRLPMDDFNTRVCVCGKDGAQAFAAAEALAHQGFLNVTYFDGTFGHLVASL
jgi:rhodanese-related sulfurtransferase